jgi:predicted permease
MGLGRILFTAVNAVTPIVILILIGYFLKRREFLTDGFLKVANKLVFNLCLPCTLFLNVYNISGIAALRWDVILYSLVMVLLFFILGLATVAVATKEPSRKGVILQCTFRSNLAIIGISLAAAIGGEEAQSVTAIITAFSVPFFNVLAVIALSIFSEDHKKPEIGKILLKIWKNPLIIGAALGLIVLGLREVQNQLWGEVIFSIKEDIPFVHSAVNQLKSIATPLALIVLGGQFELSAVKGMAKEIWVGTLWRLVVAPVLGIGVAILLSKYTTLLSFGPNDYPGLIALFGSPVAVSSAIMAQQMGSDGQLATQYVMWTSLGSVVTIFLTVCIMMAAGLIMV